MPAADLNPSSRTSSAGALRTAANRDVVQKAMASPLPGAFLFPTTFAPDADRVAKKRGGSKNAVASFRNDLTLTDAGRAHVDLVNTAALNTPAASSTGAGGSAENPGGTAGARPGTSAPNAPRQGPMDAWRPETAPAHYAGGGNVSAMTSALQNATGFAAVSVGGPPATPSVVPGGVARAMTPASFAGTAAGRTATPSSMAGSIATATPALRSSGATPLVASGAGESMYPAHQQDHPYQQRYQQPQLQSQHYSPEVQQQSRPQTSQAGRLSLRPGTGNSAAPSTSPTRGGRRAATAAAAAAAADPRRFCSKAAATPEASRLVYTRGKAAQGAAAFIIAKEQRRAASAMAQVRRDDLHSRSAVGGAGGHLGRRSSIPQMKPDSDDEGDEYGGLEFLRNNSSALESLTATRPTPVSSQMVTSRGPRAAAKAKPAVAGGGPKTATEFARAARAATGKGKQPPTIDTTGITTLPSLGLPFQHSLLQQVRVGRGAGLKTLQTVLEHKPEIRDAFFAERDREEECHRLTAGRRWAMEASSKVGQVDTELKQKASYTNPMSTRVIPDPSSVQRARATITPSPPHSSSVIV